MKRVADTGEPPVVIPVIVIAVNVHIPLVIPPVEDRPLYEVPSLSYRRANTRIRLFLFSASQHALALHTKYLHFLEVSA